MRYLFWRHLYNGDEENGSWYNNNNICHFVFTESSMSDVLHILTPASVISSSELKKLYTILREYNMETECSGIANWNCLHLFYFDIYWQNWPNINRKKIQNSSCNNHYIAIGLLSAVKTPAHQPGVHVSHIMFTKPQLQGWQQTTNHWPGAR